MVVDELIRLHSIDPQYFNHSLEVLQLLDVIELVLFLLVPVQTCIRQQLLSLFGTLQHYLSFLCQVLERSKLVDAQCALYRHPQSLSDFVSYITLSAVNDSEELIKFVRLDNIRLLSITAAKLDSSRNIGTIEESHVHVFGEVL